jgi:TPP-dependent pyruvate/acetoin dehydrogenase alpha subunit
VEEEKKNECVGRYERYLRRLGVLDEAAADQVRAEAADLMRTGITEAEAEPGGDVSLVFEHAHVDPLPAFEDDLRELRGG